MLQRRPLLCSPREQEESPDIVTGMLQVFYINVYALLDRGATLSFVTPLVDNIYLCSTRYFN